MTDFQRIVKYFALALAFSIIVGIASFIISGVGFLFGMYNSPSNKLDDLKEIEISSNINNIEIELISTNLVIEEKDSFYAATNNDRISYRMRGDTLIITERGGKLFNKSTNTDLIINLPKGVRLNEISLDAGAGKIEFLDIEVNKLDLDLGAGEVSLNGLSVIRKADVDGGVGKLSITDSVINDLELDMGVGALTLEAELRGESEISCGVGDVDISLLGDDYKIRVNKGLGTAKINDRNIKDDEVVGTGRNTVEIDGGVGGVTVDFEQWQDEGPRF